MVTPEEDVEIHALRARGWSISAIARHTGRDRKTVRACLVGERRRGRRATSPLDPYRPFIAARFDDDPHLPATVLLRELRELGFERSYPTLTRELRRLSLRPRCAACRRGGHTPTIEIPHPPGEELQLDWLELRETPWGEPAYVLVGALSHSGRFRCAFTDAIGAAHLVDCLDRVLRKLSGTPRSWRTDRLQGAVHPGTDRLLASFAQAAKHYGASVVICPARRPQRKGVVEAAIRYVQNSWWRAARVGSPAAAERSLDAFCGVIADQRPRGSETVRRVAEREPLAPLPELPFPAELRAERQVSRSGLVSFAGNRYSVPAAGIGQAVTVSRRLGDETLAIVSAQGSVLARHRAAPPGAGQTVRSPEHRVELERAVLFAFTTAPPCPRKRNRPPGEAALAVAARLGAEPGSALAPPDLSRYAELAEAVR